MATREGTVTTGEYGVRAGEAITYCPAVFVAGELAEWCWPGETCALRLRDEEPARARAIA